jgi:hypothetical protein
MAHWGDPAYRWRIIMKAFLAWEMTVERNCVHGQRNRETHAMILTERRCLQRTTSSRHATGGGGNRFRSDDRQKAAVILAQVSMYLSIGVTGHRDLVEGKARPGTQVRSLA